MGTKKNQLYMNLPLGGIVKSVGKGGYFYIFIYICIYINIYTYTYLYIYVHIDR